MDKWNNVSLMPRWMRLTMSVCKWLILFMPFVMISIMTIMHEYESVWDNWLVTCVYLLSLANIINIVDKD